MKNTLLGLPLLAAAVLTAACAASSGSSAGAPAGPGSAGATSTSSGTSSSGTSTSSGTSPSSGASTPSGASTSSAGPSSAASSGSASDTGSIYSGALACKSANLRVSLGGGAGAGMSQNHTGLQLRNVGSSPCSLYGYPGVSWVAGADGHQVGAAATRQPNNGGTEHIVTLAAGATASAPLDIVNASALPPSACKPVAVRGLRVYPPGQTAAMYLPLPTAKGGYGECSVATKQPTLIVGYMQSGVQPGGGSVG